MESKMLENTIETKKGTIKIAQERITYTMYYEFLTRTDLGKQYPKERFEERITKLLKNIQISLIARNEKKEIVGICFGLTDYSYWLLVTDLGIDRNYEKNGIGKELMKQARKEAGGSKDIIVFTYANENAVDFYKKIGMNKSTEMMEQTDIEWTSFTVGEKI
jgi:ribosomal protein S18 acetylase RimI-like enzyme